MKLIFFFYSTVYTWFSLLICLVFQQNTHEFLLFCLIIKSVDFSAKFWSTLWFNSTVNIDDSFYQNYSKSEFGCSFRLYFYSLRLFCSAAMVGKNDRCRDMRVPATFFSVFVKRAIYCCHLWQADYSATFYMTFRSTTVHLSSSFLMSYVYPLHAFI